MESIHPHQIAATRDVWSGMTTCVISFRHNVQRQRYDAYVHVPNLPHYSLYTHVTGTSGGSKRAAPRQLRPLHASGGSTLDNVSKCIRPTQTQPPAHGRAQPASAHTNPCPAVSRTFKFPVDARERQARVAELEHDVRAREQVWQVALELQHMTGEP